MTNILTKIKERLPFLKDKKENSLINIESEIKNEKNMMQGIKEFWQSKKWIFILAGIAVLLLTGSIYRYYLTKKVFTEYSTVSISETADVENSRYLAFGEYLLHYTLDGISCVDKKGTLIWGQAYEIKSPIVDICEDYVAVAAQRGNIIYIFNKSGYQGEISTLYPIVNIEVARQGVVVAVMEDAGTNYVKIYDVKGTELVTMTTSLEGRGYPFAIGLSPDGKKLVLSSLNITSNKIENIVEFYNFSEVGQNYKEQLVGTFSEFKNSLIPKITFINNTTVCAFMENQIGVFSINEIPEELVLTIPISGEIKTIFHDDRYIGVVISDNDDAIYRLFVYNTKGKMILEKPIYQDFKDIYFWEENIVLYNSYDCQIIGLDGTIRFDYTFDNDIALLKPVSYTNFVWASSSFISEIHLK